MIKLKRFLSVRSLRAAAALAAAFTALAVRGEGLVLPYANLPAGYEQVEYIRASGKGSSTPGAYAKTGYMLQPTDVVSAGVQFQTLEANACIWCSRDANGTDNDNSYTLFVLPISNPSGWRFDHYMKSSSAQATGSVSANTDYAIRTSPPKELFINGDAPLTFSNSEFSSGSKYEVILFASHTGANGKCDASGNYADMRMYYFSVTDSNGKSKLNFVPCIEVSSGKVGLYDTVGGNFLSSANDKKFEVGPAVPKPLDVDYYWRTNEVGGGVSADLSSPEGWQDGLVPNVPTANCVYFLASGTYRPQQTDGERALVLGKTFVYGRDDAEEANADVRFIVGRDPGVENGSSVLFDTLTVGKEGRNDDKFSFSVTDGSQLLVTNQLLVAGGSSTFSFAGGSVFETTGQVTRFGDETGSSSVKSDLKFVDSTWLASAVNFGDQVNDPSQISISMDARGSTLNFAGDVAMLSGEKFYLSNDVTTVAGELCVDRDSQLDVQEGSLVASSVSLGGASGSRGSLVLRDNAVLETSRVFSPAASGMYGSLELNNGTLRVAPTVEAGAVFVDGTSGLDLTIDRGTTGTVDTNGRDVFLGCGVSAKYGGFVKTGDGTLVVSNKNIVAQTVEVEKGVLHAASDGVVLGTSKYTVGPEGALSFFGQVKTPEVYSLTVNQGVLEFDPDDCLTIVTPDGDVGQEALTLLSPKIRLSKFPEPNTTMVLMKQNGRSGAMGAWEKATLLNHVEFGYKIDFSAKWTDGAGGGVSEFKLTYTKVKETAWTGAGGTLEWDNPSNWSAGVPTGDYVAKLDLKEPTEIVLPNDSVVYAVGVTGADCVFTNGSLRLSAPDASVSVEKGKKLEIASALSGTSMAKEGAGTLVVAQGFNFGDWVTVRAGTLEAAADPSCPVILVGGTFKIRESVESLSGLEVATANETDAVVVWNEAKVDVSEYVCRQGALVKRGDGLLSLRVADGSVLAAGEDWPLAPPESALQFSEDGGVSPVKDADGRFFYAPLTVTAGELRFQPQRTAKDSTRVLVLGDVLSGRWAGAEASKNSALVTFDSLDVDMSNHVFYAGFGGVGGGLGLRSAALGVKELIGGVGCTTGVSRLGITNSTMEVVQSANFGTDAGTLRTLIGASESELRTGAGLAIRSAVDADFKASLLEVGVDGLVFDPAKTSGQFTFREGAVLAHPKISGLENVAQPFGFVFKDATWDVSSAPEPIFLMYGDNFSVRSEGKNKTLTVNVAPGGKFQFHQNPLLGNGGIAVSGGGRVGFGAGMFKLDAESAIQAVDGVLELSGVGVVSRPQLLAGKGQVVGGVFLSANILLPKWDGSTVLKLEGCSFSGETIIKVSEDVMPQSPFRMKVAEYVGTSPDVSNWKLDAATGAAGQFVALGGEIFANVSEHGLYIIVK